MWCFPGGLWCIIGDLLYLGPLPPPSKSLSLPVLHRLALLLIGYSCLLSLWLCAASPLPRLKIFYAERYGVQTLGTPRMTTVLVLGGHPLQQWPLSCFLPSSLSTRTLPRWYLEVIFLEILFVIANKNWASRSHCFMLQSPVPSSRARFFFSQAPEACPAWRITQNNLRKGEWKIIPVHLLAA